MAFAVTGLMPRIRLHMLHMPLIALAVVATLTAACDKKSPSEPSTTPTGANVSLIGTVSAPVPAGLRVTVGSTSNSAQVDSTGQFAITNAPSGTVDLRFTGPGISSSLSLANLLADQTVTMVVTVSGQIATLESCRRVRGTDEEIEGRIESLAPPNSFRSGGPHRLDGSVHDLHGGRPDGGLRRARNRTADHGQGPEQRQRARRRAGRRPDAGRHRQPQPERRISNFTGTRGAFQFTVGGTQVQADAATIFDAGSLFNEMANGLAIAVTGVQRTGFVYATRLTITSPTAAFTGRIISTNGTPPAARSDRHDRNGHGDGVD
jgi:hypothetical protein